MPNDNLLYDWYDSQNPEPEKEFIEREFRMKKMLKEVAIHEASHLVFGILITRLNLGFTNCDGVFIEVNEDTSKGATQGFIPPVGQYDFQGAINWYQQEPVRLWAKLFSTLVGYLTYNAFFSNKNKDYFISHRTGAVQDKSKVYYYNLKTALRMNPYHGEDPRTSVVAKIHDLYLVNKYCRLLGFKTQNEKIQLCNKIMEDLLAVLSKGAIRSSVGFIKNRLLENKDVKKEIIGEQLQEIIDQVDKFTKNVSLEKLTQKYLDLHPQSGYPQSG